MSSFKQSCEFAMSEPVTQLMQEFLIWVASRPRTYADAMQAWQSTCPRHTIWEDAVIDGFIQVKNNGTQHGSEVTLTARGRAIIQTVQPLV
jgi:hypothetical protein